MAHRGNREYSVRIARLLGIVAVTTMVLAGCVMPDGTVYTLPAESDIGAAVHAVEGDSDTPENADMRAFMRLNPNIQLEAMLPLAPAQVQFSIPSQAPAQTIADRIEDRGAEECTQTRLPGSNCHFLTKN